MSERSGLSIFDEPDDLAGGAGGADAATQVIPAVKAPQQRQGGPAEQRPAPAPPGGRPAAAPAPRPAAAPAPSRTTTRPSFPVVRRGYDTAAVDRHVQAMSGLAAGLDEARATIATLEARLQEASTRLAENENPTYAGLGGRASEMLRLAEE